MTDESIDDLHAVIWGNSARFLQASQPCVTAWLESRLEWSEHEDFALVQRQGGPCVVLAPLQAYIISVLKDLPQPSSSDNARVSGESSERPSGSTLPTSIDGDDMDEGCEESTPLTSGCVFNVSRDRRNDILEKAVLKIFGNFDNPPQLMESLENSNTSNLTLAAWIELLFQPGGILLLLYSIVKTKTAASIRQDIGFLTDTVQLIEPENGHGEQSLVNLLLFGTATSNVFDGMRDLGGGLMLAGLNEKSNIGFLSMHEAYRYLEVGDNYKQPIYPIWVLSSETHFTVFWTSFDVLTSQTVEAGKERARMKQTLLQFDSGGGFFEADKLPMVLQSCGLMHEPAEYVEIVKSELDPDGLDVIMIGGFMDHFCEESPSGGNSAENLTQSGRCFDVFHYNGRVQSNPSEQVKFRSGKAQLVDFMPSGLAVDSLEQILQTRWKQIQVEWDQVLVNGHNVLPLDY